MGITTIEDEGIAQPDGETSQPGQPGLVIAFSLGQPRFAVLPLEPILPPATATPARGSPLPSWRSGCPLAAMCCWPTVWPTSASRAST